MLRQNKNNETSLNRYHNNSYIKFIKFLAPVIVSTIIPCIMLRIWEFDIHSSIGLEGDGLLLTMLVKSLKENGLVGFFFNPRIGAPEVSALIDVPFCDIPMAIILYFISFFIPSVSGTIYVFFILTFTTAAASMYYLLTKVTSSYLIQFIFSIAFAITPYHFLRGLSHLSLANYFIIPIGISLALLIYQQEFCRWMPVSYKNNKKKLIALYISIAVIGLSNIYYSFFIIVLVAISVICKLIRKRTIRVLVYEAHYLYLLCFSFIVGLLPKLIYGIYNGANEVAGIRSPIESEIYGLKIVQMLLPANYSRINLFREAYNEYTNNAFNINENTYAILGVFACIGFIVSCIWLIRNYIAKIEGNNIVDLMNYISLSILVIVLFCIPGGFGTIFSYCITPQLRALNRGSIIIVALSILSCAIFFNYILDKLNRKIISTGIFLLFIFVLYAEVPQYDSGWHTEIEKLDLENKNYFAKIENELNEGSMVYQLPMVDFPEMPSINRMSDYSHFIAYIYTDNIKWSYGGVKGRNAVAKSLNVDNGMSIEFLKNIINLGFSGVYIDCYGYEDNGILINEFYQTYVNNKPIISNDGRYYFYKIQNNIADIELKFSK